LYHSTPGLRVMMKKRQEVYLVENGLHLVEKIVVRTPTYFRGGLVFKAHRWLYHSTLGSRVIKKKRSMPTCCGVLGFGSGSSIEGV